MNDGPHKKAAEPLLSADCTTPINSNTQPCQDARPSVRTARKIKQIRQTPGTRWVMLALVLFFAYAWFSDLVPYEAVWGDYAAWAAAIATGGGLIFAGMSIRLQTRQRKEALEHHEQAESETRKAHARSVGFKAAWVEHTFHGRNGKTENCWAVKYAIQNASPFPITNAVVSLWDLMTPIGAHYSPDDEEGQKKLDRATERFAKAQREGWDNYVNVAFGTILSGEKFEGVVPVLHPDAGPDTITGRDPDAKLEFVDAWNSPWRRSASTVTASEGPACMCAGCTKRAHW